MGCEGFLKGDAEMEERRILNVECRILKGGSVLDLPQRREGRRGARRFFEGKRGGAEGAEGDAEQNEGNMGGVSCWVVVVGCFGFTAKARRSRRGAMVFVVKRGGAEDAEEDTEMEEGRILNVQCGIF
jgi:hypothetical protein